MIAMTDEVCELREYNSDLDDRRGGSYRVGYYRTRAAAQARADKLNNDILANQNRVEASLHNQRIAAAKERHNRAVTETAEHNALVSAGLRTGPFQTVPAPSQILIESFVPKTALRTFTPPEDWVPQVTTHGNRTYTERWHAEDHYYVDAIEFDG